MPFLRPGTVAAFASPTPKILQLGLLTLFSFSAAAKVSAKPHKASKSSKKVSRTSKPTGVFAWTSGSQTYIRSRPGANVPPVAKVPRHTKLFVWGKFNGWYRVETPDHIFGWVYNDYLNSPGLEKVPDMPQSQARLASDRTANQVMYGTPAMLKKHYATYRAPGALEGLKKQGIYLATAPKKSSKPKTVIASVKRQGKPAVVSAKPRVATVPRVRERVVIEPVAPRAFTPRKAPVAPVETSPIPAVEDQEKLAPVTAVSPLPNSAESAEARGIDADRIAGAARGGTSSVRMFARAASAAASQSATQSNSAPASPAPVAVVPVAPVVTKPVVSKPVVKAAAKPAPRKVAAKPKPKPAAKKAVARQRPHSRHVATRDRKREQLRVQMGLSPKVSPPSVIAPVSPIELMKAREEYLNSRKARLGSPAPAPAENPDTPTIGVAPLPTPSGPLGGPDSDSLPPASPANISPTSFEGVESLQLPLLDESVHPLYPLMSAPEVVALAQLKPKAPAVSKAAPVAARGGSPRDRMGMTRGGSPRDRMGAGMANQALSYRGMPYIRGAASPSRGFDCSGLIYFLLRQRGYNPPRTAAGYKNWGTSVPRGQWKAGDLVLFANTYKRGISHIGVYLGEGKFVHAATTRTGVRVSSLNEAYYAKKYYGARRIK